LITLSSWLAVFKFSKYVSLASIVAAVVMPVAVWLTGATRPTVYAMIALGLLTIYKHRSNIQRLLNGTENKVGVQKAAP
jgi:acyl phosphate:glycerol-3-phosphate acyltransferase